MRIIEVEGGALFESRSWSRFFTVNDSHGSGETCLLIGSIMALFEQEDISSTIGVDPEFLSGLRDWLALLTRWYPLYNPLIDVETRSRTVGSRTIMPFSAGVDSFYTFESQRGDPLYIRGFDREQNDPLHQEIISRIRKTAGSVTIMVTNIREVLDGYDWGFAHDPALIALCYAAGSEYSRALISSHYPLDRPGTFIYPSSLRKGVFYSYGNYISHLLSGPLHVRYIGTHFDRFEKISFLRTSNNAKTSLRVCWNGDFYNCGTCYKCVHTTILAHLAHVRFETLPLLDRGSIRTMKLRYGYEFDDWLKTIRKAFELKHYGIVRDMLIALFKSGVIRG